MKRSVGTIKEKQFHKMDHEHGYSCEWCVVGGEDQEFWVNKLNEAFNKGYNAGVTATLSV